MSRPVKRERKGEQGFALLLVFVMAAAIALMLYRQMPRAAFESERDKEQLLIDRGSQYQRAIQLFFLTFRRYPSSIDDLESTNNRRFLRRRYIDPFTGKKEWRLVHTNGMMLTDSKVQAPPSPNGNGNGTGASSTSQTASASFSSGGTPGADQPPAVNAAVAARASDRSLPSNQSYSNSPAAGGYQINQQNPNNQNYNDPASYPPISYPPISLYPNGYNTSNQPGQNQPGQPGGLQPIPGQPGLNQPGFNQPGGFQQPGLNQPGLNQPGFNQPGFNQPGLNQPGQPGFNQPGLNQQVNQYPGQPYPTPGTPIVVSPTGVQQGLTQQGLVQPPAQQFQGQQYPGQTLPGQLPVQATPGQPYPNNPPNPAPFNPSDPGATGAGNPALGMIQQLLTTQRPAPAGIGPANPTNNPPAAGGGLAGVASTFIGPTIKSYGGRTDYSEWEFVYQLPTQQGVPQNGQQQNGLQPNGPQQNGPQQNGPQQNGPQLNGQGPGFGSLGVGGPGGLPTQTH